MTRLVVWAFDRDHTVDSSPDPGPVKLDWIKWLHRATPHEVWAIGNQALCAEAGIPGTEEMARRLKEAGATPDLERDVNFARGSKWKERRNIGMKHKRMAALKLLIPHAEFYVCVDDFDISQPGWKYYTPERFAHKWDTKMIRFALETARGSR